MKDWELVFKTLANVNRLKIVKMLSGAGRLDVTGIAEKLGISIKAASQHLIILKNVGVLEDIGKNGHVYYLLKEKLPNRFTRVIKMFI